MNIRILLLTLTSLLLPMQQAAGADSDPRQLVDMPPAVAAHMLASMRSHLQAIADIQLAAASGKFDKAATIAENRLGLPSMEHEGASTLAPYMPKPMRQMGMQMHRAASHFAMVARDTEVDGDVRRAMTALGHVTQRCVACHSAYRIH